MGSPMFSDSPEIDAREGFSIVFDINPMSTKKSSMDVF